MNTKQWAVFFVALLSVDYATAGSFGGYRGGGNGGYYGWSEGCRCNDVLTSRLDEALENAKGHFGRSRSGYSLQDTNLEEYEFTGGNIRGLNQFERKGPYRCSLSRKYVRVYFSIGFFRLLANYTASLAEDILGGFFGGAVSVVGNVLGTAADLILQVTFPDVYVTCVLYQRLGGRRGFEVESLHMNTIENFSFQNKRFSRHQDSLGSYFRPILDQALRIFFHDEFARVLNRYFHRVISEKGMFYYESSSRKRYGGYNGGGQYEESDESEQSYSYEYSSEYSESSEE